MGEDEAEPLTVASVVEYCETQARLLAGRIETISDEVDDLLDEIDAELARVQSRLAAATDVDETVRPASTAGPGDESVDVAEIEDLESDLESKQTLADAKQTRLRAFQELAVGYADLAADLQTDAEDGGDALSTVVRFEADNDAPAYFEDRTTLCEIVAESAAE